MRWDKRIWRKKSSFQVYMGSVAPASSESGGNPKLPSNTKSLVPSALRKLSKSKVSRPISLLSNDAKSTFNPPA